MKTIAAVIKKNLESIRSEILKNIKDIVIKQQGEYLEIYDYRGSLVIGGDDQESVVIGSLETRGNSVTANWGVYTDEDGYTHIEEYNIELLVNILEACERAEDDLKREEQIDESMQADLN